MGSRSGVRIRPGFKDSRREDEGEDECHEIIPDQHFACFDIKTVIEFLLL
jgi:hypothetical protein